MISELSNEDLTNDTSSLHLLPRSPVITPRKKKLALKSDAFPKTTDKNVKILHTSKIHDLISSSSQQPILSNIYFKELSEADIPELSLLHKEWFPIKYNDQFFNENLSENKIKETFNIGAYFNIDSTPYLVILK